MFRKIVTLLSATVVVFAMLPALAASAAPAASASWTSGASVLPGAREFSISVRNAESGGLFGVGAGASINGMELLLPPNLSSIACKNATVGSFACRVSGRSVILEGGSLAPGATLAVPFNATAAAPYDQDRVLGLDVRVSSDNRQTSDSAGRLDLRVRALELLPTTLRVLGFNPDNPATNGLVTDGTATTGQSIRYGYEVKNYAQQPVTVSGTLASNGAETITSPQTATIQPGTSALLAFPVTLGAQASGSRTPTFTAEAKIGTGSTTGTVTAANLAIQAKPVLSALGTFAPLHVRSNDGTDYTFTFNADKANPPALTSFSGSINFGGGCTITTQSTCSNQLPLTAPAGIGSGGVSGVNFSTGLEDVVGQDGLYDVFFTFAGTDGNGAPYSQTTSLTQLLTIDNINPLVDVVLGIPDGQLAAKDGDTVTVDVTVTDGTLNGPVTLDIQPENGSTVTVPVDGCANGQSSCSGTVVLSGLAGDHGTLTATANAIDLAENTGVGQSLAADFDGVRPLLQDGARIVDGAPYGEDVNVVEVTVVDRGLVHGGCDPVYWDIDAGESNDLIVVTDVLYSNGEPCDADSTPTDPSADNPLDNILVLVPSQDLVAQNVYNVEFVNEIIFGNSSPINDGALNSVLDQVVSTVDGVIPDLPVLVGLTRNGDAEETVFDEGVYWTRFGNNDALATIQNSRGGYLVRVYAYDSNGTRTILTEETADGSNYAAEIPIGTAEGIYTRGIQFVNNSGLAGDIFTFDIGLDLTAPTVSGATSTADTATITFGEPIWAGAPRTQDWFALENNPFAGQGEDPYFQYRADTMSGSGTSRVLEGIEFQNYGTFAGVEYRFDQVNADAAEQTRLEDRAGNYLQDVLFTS